MTIRGSRFTPEYLWNENASRYINASTGRFVSGQEVRDALEGVVTQANRNITALSEQLQAGSVTLAEWQARMTSELRNLHGASAAAARGGWAQMSPADWGATGSKLRTQYAFLNDFVTDIEQGYDINTKSFLRRARMYGDAGIGTYEESRREELRPREIVAERRVLGLADHCNTAGGVTGCEENAAKGWQPIGSLPSIGVSPCITNCKCHFEFLRADGSVSR